jgi:hypothetical protein
MTLERKGKDYYLDWNVVLILAEHSLCFQHSMEWLNPGETLLVMVG